MNKFTVLFLTLALSPLFASAHQPVVVSSGEMSVTEPAISKAYYDNLRGTGRIYVFEESQPFPLYLNLLVPKDTNPLGRYSAKIYSVSGNALTQLAVLDGSTTQWTEFYEDYGKDDYLKGPEFRTTLPGGQYAVEVVGTSKNVGRYVLAVGETERWTPVETYRTVRALSIIKKDFFGKNPGVLLTNVFGLGYALSLLAVGIIAGILLRKILQKKFVGKLNTRANIGKRDRQIRLALAIIFFAYTAGTTSWNPFLFAASGFLFYEAVAGWCGLFQVTGKNTCSH